jgi:hypothetical protein
MFLLTTDDLDHRKTTRFNVVNNGHEGFRTVEIKWNIFVEADTFSSSSRGSGYPWQAAKLFGKDYRHYSDVIQFPQYPGESATAIEITLRWTGGERSRPIYFYLATVEGLFPRTIKLNNDGQVIPETLLNDGANQEIELPKNFTSP